MAIATIADDDMSHLPEGARDGVRKSFEGHQLH